MTAPKPTDTPVVHPAPPAPEPAPAPDAKPPKEFGGPQGPEPTRFGDWERNGRCSDF